MKNDAAIGEKLEALLARINAEETTYEKVFRSEPADAVLLALAAHYLDKFTGDTYELEKFGALFGNRNCHEGARLFFGKTWELEPANIHAFGEYCRALYFLKRTEELLAVTEQAFLQAGGEKHAELFYWKYNALQRLGRKTEAFDVAQEGCDHFPGDDYLLASFGYAYYELGDYEKAIHYYNEALKVDPADVDTLLNKACSLTLLGRYDQAFTNLMTLIDINPKYLKKAMKDRELDALFASEYGEELRRLIAGKD